MTAKDIPDRRAPQTATGEPATSAAPRWRTRLASALGGASPRQDALRIVLIAVPLGLLVLTAAVAFGWWMGSERAAAPGRVAAASASAPQSTGATPPAEAASGMAAASAAGSAPMVAIAPNLRPRLAEAAARGAPTHYALVSPALASRDEAQALLARLRQETARIHHPTATETSIDQTPQGWRISWWPFTGQKQAENARAAMAAHRITLEVVDF